MIDWDTCPICDKALDTTSIGFCSEQVCPEGHYKLQGFHYIVYEYIDGKRLDFDESGYGCPTDEERNELIENARKKHFRTAIWHA